MNLTHKAISLMCGFDVVQIYTSYPNLKLDWGTYYRWTNKRDGESSGPYKDEETAWKECCLCNKLIEEV